MINYFYLLNNSSSAERRLSCSYMKMFSMIPLSFRDKDIKNSMKCIFDIFNCQVLLGDNLLMENGNKSNLYICFQDQARAKSGLGGL